MPQKEKAQAKTKKSTSLAPSGTLPAKASARDPLNLALLPRYPTFEAFPDRLHISVYFEGPVFPVPGLPICSSMTSGVNQLIRVDSQTLDGGFPPGFDGYLE